MAVKHAEGRRRHDRRRLDRRDRSARSSARTGTTMVSLEQGDARWTYPHFAHDHDSLRYSVRYAMMVDLAARDVDVAAEPDARRRCRCGSTARSTPARASAARRSTGRRSSGASSTTDFRYRSHVVERYGAQKIPAGCTVQDWGVTYDELEPYYDAFEWDIGASGQAGQHPRQEDPPGGNPFEAPRSRGYPNPPLDVTTARRERSPTACDGARPAPVHAAGGDHLARVHRPVRQPPRRLPLLRLLHALRLRGRREGEPAQHPPPGRARDAAATRCARRRKVLRIETGDRTGSRPASPTSTRTGQEHFQPAERGRRLRVHAREQPAAPALTQQGAPARDRQRPRPRRQELHLPDLPGAGHRRSGRARS